MSANVNDTPENEEMRERVVKALERLGRPVHVTCIRDFGAMWCGRSPSDVGGQFFQNVDHAVENGRHELALTVCPECFEVVVKHLAFGATERACPDCKLEERRVNDFGGGVLVELRDQKGGWHGFVPDAQVTFAKVDLVEEKKRELREAQKRAGTCRCNGTGKVKP